MFKIRFGPAGSPRTPTIRGVEEVHRLGLDALEIEFVRGVYIKNEDAERIGKLANDLDVELSVHAPYWINLASLDKNKVVKSRKFILDSCERAHLLGAKIVVFHAGYYQKYSKSECYEIIKREIGSLTEKIKERNWRVKLAPETTGKPSQFGSLDEILSLMEDLGTDVCIDFAHINARDKGIDYSSLFDRLEKLKKIHSHFSGIEYTQKGERRHLVVERNDFLPLANEILKRKINITIISESPITWRDSLKMKGIMEELMNFNKSTSSIS